MRRLANPPLPASETLRAIAEGRPACVRTARWKVMLGMGLFGPWLGLVGAALWFTTSKGLGGFVGVFVLAALIACVLECARPTTVTFAGGAILIRNWLGRNTRIDLVDVERFYLRPMGRWIRLCAFKSAAHPFGSLPANLTEAPDDLVFALNRRREALARADVPSGAVA